MLTLYCYLMNVGDPITSYYGGGIAQIILDYTRRARVAPLGLLCEKTFKSLRSETSDRCPMDLIVSKTVKNVIL